MQLAGDTAAFVLLGPNQPSQQLHPGLIGPDQLHGSLGHPGFQLIMGLAEGIFHVLPIGQVSEDLDELAGPLVAEPGQNAGGVEP